MEVGLLEPEAVFKPSGSDKEGPSQSVVSEARLAFASETRESSVLDEGDCGSSGCNTVRVAATLQLAYLQIRNVV